MTDPDAALMLAFAAGEEAAFVELYRRYRDRMVHFCRRLLGDQARAEEAAQDVFIKVYDAAARYQVKSRFSTYLYRVATNHCLNLNARVERRLVKDGDEDLERAKSPTTPCDDLSQRQLRAALAEALATLPDKQRAALLLVHYEGFSYREAASAVAVSESALKSLVHRARERMTHQLRHLVAESGDVLHAM